MTGHWGRRRKDCFLLISIVADESFVELRKHTRKETTGKTMCCVCLRSGSAGRMHESQTHRTNEWKQPADVPFLCLYNCPEEFELSEVRVIKISAMCSLHIPPEK